MTAQEVISQVNGLRPNPYSDDDKLRWLSNLDALIWQEVISWHEGAPVKPEAYTSLDTTLLVSEPYSDIYIKHLLLQIDYYNAEYARYNNDMVMYNMALENFSGFYNRTNIPKKTAIRLP